jgi:hypothetical protein
MSFLLGVFTGLFVWHTFLALVTMAGYAFNVSEAELNAVLINTAFALIFGLLTVLTFIGVI